jgi:hypothetical protein
MSKFIDRFLWLIILGPILLISAYSFYTVTTRAGALPIFAIGFSTVFDGVAIFAARYSTRYIEAGMSSFYPRAVVIIFAALGAYIQAFHADINGNNVPAHSWIIWSSLPVAGALVFDIHHRWAKRGVLASNGVTYPRPVPRFSLLMWTFAPRETTVDLKGIVSHHKKAIVANAIGTVQNSQSAIESPEPEPTPTPTTPRRREPLHVITTARPSTRRTARDRRHAPVAHVRRWAKSNGWPDLADNGRLSNDILAAYANREAAS